MELTASPSLRCRRTLVSISFSLHPPPSRRRRAWLTRSPRPPSVPAGCQLVHSGATGEPPDANTVVITSQVWEDLT